MNIWLMKQLDATVGRLCASFLPPVSSTPLCTTPQSFLVIRPGGIGDAVLLAPTLIGLKRRFAHAHITVLGERRNAGVLQLVPDVDVVVRYDVAHEFLQIFRANYDVVIDTEQYHRLSAVVGRVMRAGLRIGFATNERARLFHAPIPYSHDDYETESFWHLLGPLGIERNLFPETPFLSVPWSAKKRADKLLGSWKEARLVVLFPGASIPERRWGADKFAQLAAGLANRGYVIVVVGGAEDAICGDIILRDISGVNLAGQTTLAETAAVLEHAEVLISGDSGILHLAVGLGLPTVSLFGPGIVRKWGPRGRRDVILNKTVSCSPCTRFGYMQPCHNGVICLQRVSSQEVIAAVLSVVAP